MQIPAKNVSYYLLATSALYTGEFIIHFRIRKITELLIIPCLTVQYSVYSYAHVPCKRLRLCVGTWEKNGATVLPRACRVSIASLVV